MRRRDGSPTRVLTTVVFTDIVGSTEIASRIGDGEWRRLLERHRAYVRANLRRFGGHEVDTAGDGFFATFDAPARAVAFALATVGGAPEFGIEIRAGVHMGEVERSRSGVAGVAVHIGSRIAARAEPSSVLVSSTVRDLVVGSGVRFEDEGGVELKGVSEPWHLYRAVAGPATADPPGDMLDPARGEAAVAAAERQAGIRRGLRGAVATRRGRTAAALLAIAWMVIVASVGWYVWSAPHLLPGVPPHSVGKIDPSANGIAAAVPVGALPDAITDGDGALWVTDATDGMVSKVDPSSLQVKDRFAVGAAPGAIAFGAGSVWVADSANRTVWRVDPGTTQVVGSYTVGNGPNALAASDTAVWATNRLDGTLSRIDLATGLVTSTRIGVTPAGIAVAAGSLWVSDLDAGSVIRIDAATGLEISRVAVGDGPATVASDGDIVWVVNSRNGTVSRIDPLTNSVTATQQVGDAPTGIAVGPDGVWVAVASSAEMVRLDPATGQVVKRISVGNSPEDVTVAGSEPWFTVQAGTSSHRGGTLRISDTSVPPPDPDQLGFGIASRLTNAALVGYRQVAGLDGFTLVANLATAIPAPTDGGLTYAFQLRSGILYSDGRTVEASDVRRSMERYVALVDQSVFPFLDGVSRCESGPPPVCDLSSGITTDDATDTVTFHLSQPDGDFIVNLAVVPIVPSDSPLSAVNTPLPANGPYMIDPAEVGADGSTSTELKLVRNPHFHIWSSEALPDGYPDTIEWTLAPEGTDPVSLVESGEADWTPTDLSKAQIESLRTGHAAQLHVFPGIRAWIQSLNTTVPPFDRQDVRQALSLATDRQMVLDAWGGPLSGRITCQYILPGFPGYQPYCPYTAGADASGAWRAPDLARAQSIIDGSGTKGMTVNVIGFDDPGFAAITNYFGSLLDELGYDAKVTVMGGGDFGVYDSYITDPANASTVQSAGYWVSGGAATPYAWVIGAFACDAQHQVGPGDYVTRWCDPQIDARVQDAVAAEVSDPAAANDIWAEVDRMITDAAPAVFPFDPTDVIFVSDRVGNVQEHVVDGLMIDQLWVQ